MSPEIEIKSLSRDDSSGNFFKTRELNKEKRLIIYHIVTHVLAFIIIISYIVMAIFQIDTPREYSTIVSVVVGFYFARALFN